ncbi:hypothetical protein [Caulobacter endophyticus]|uniref:hypothetical protein n=1 Tax=Caulobacter endophyticus TaxID=2172652 RepID=UPI0013050246|nr:hypothetical protein [Caulobacter endophyticus]
MSEALGDGNEHAHGSDRFPRAAMAQLPLNPIAASPDAARASVRAAILTVSDIQG